jgi:hypothetical protein
MEPSKFPCKDTQLRTWASSDPFVLLAANVIPKNGLGLFFEQKSLKEIVILSL